MSLNVLLACGVVEGDHPRAFDGLRVLRFLAFGDA